MVAIVVRIVVKSVPYFSLSHIFTFNFAFTFMHSISQTIKLFLLIRLKLVF
jgi:hypothetical protein